MANLRLSVSTAVSLHRLAEQFNAYTLNAEAFLEVR